MPSRRRPARRWLLAAAIVVAAAVAGLGAVVGTRGASFSVGADGYVVSPNGSDAAVGSAEHPWRTLRHALHALRPGDTLYVRDGVYVEQLGGPTPLRIRPGTAARPIEVEAYPGEHPLVAGLLWLDRPSYWTIDGLDVTWHTGDTENEHMVKVTNGVGWRLTNMVIWGAHSYADLLVAGTTTGRPANWRVDHDCIHTTYPTHPGIEDHNVYVNTGVTAGRGEIDHDVVFDAPNGENIKIGGASTTGGSANVLVADNTLFNAAQPILVAGRSHGITITGNLVDGALRRYVVRAFGLTGAQVDARRNLAYSAKRFIWNDAASATGIADAGGNVIAKGHAFEATDSCSAFTPRDALAKRYGAGD